MTSAISRTGLEKYYKTGKVFFLAVFEQGDSPRTRLFGEKLSPRVERSPPPPPTPATNAPTFHTFPHTTWQTVYT